MTVAVLPVLPPAKWTLSDKDIEVETTRGSGPGGQHRNTTDSCVKMKHLPTGITVRVDARDQHRNRALAREILETRVAEKIRAEGARRENDRRRALLGSGERGDKVRTYREADGIVTDHRTGKKAPLRKVLQGKIDLLR